MSKPPKSEKQVIIGEHWEVGKKIGSGSFGEIYAGVDRRTNENVAIKVEAVDAKYPQLVDEFRVYQSIKEGPGIPKVHWCGVSGRCNAMVMELLGESLETLYKKCNSKFSLKTVVMLAVQLLDRIEWQHANHYVHRDIKPDNFLMGLGDKRSCVYLIDMGLSKRYREPVGGKHIPYRENKKLIGTPRYASINTHLGIESCRRDDLESVGYMLLYFLAGNLPWQGMKAKTKQEKYDKISQKKISTTMEELGKGCPPEFGEFVMYCRGLRFTMAPDYGMWRAKFTDILEKLGQKNDGVFDWLVIEDVPRLLPNADIAPSSAFLPVAARQWGGGPSLLKAERVVELMEGYEKMEAERDHWKRKFEHTEILLEKYRREIQLLRRHISVHSLVPYPTPTDRAAPIAIFPPSPTSFPPAPLAPLDTSNRGKPNGVTRRHPQFPAAQPPESFAINRSSGYKTFMCSSSCSSNCSSCSCSGNCGGPSCAGGNGMDPALGARQFERKRRGELNQRLAEESRLKTDPLLAE